MRIGRVLHEVCDFVTIYGSGIDERPFIFLVVAGKIFDFDGAKFGVFAFTPAISLQCSCNVSDMLLAVLPAKSCDIIDPSPP